MSSERGRLSLRFVGRVLAGLLAVGLCGWLASYAGRTLVVARDVPQPEALVVLGSHEWERLPAVARLAQQNARAVVLLTEPGRPTPHNCYLCAERVPWLQRLGVDGQRIVVLPTVVNNTYDEARVAFEYCRERSISRLIVVTSPYHTRRALATFSTVFRSSPTIIGVQPASDDSPATPDRWWRQAYDRAYVQYEWAALAWYGIRYGVSPLTDQSVEAEDLPGARVGRTGTLFRRGDNGALGMRT